MSYDYSRLKQIYFLIAYVNNFYNNVVCTIKKLYPELLATKQLYLNFRTFIDALNCICKYFQKTYARIPREGQANINFMNSLDCPISVRVSSVDGVFNEHLEVEARLNGLLYELEPAIYDLDVRVQEGCQEVETFVKKSQVTLVEEKVGIQLQMKELSQQD